MRKFAMILIVLALAGSAMARDKKPDYQVGTFVSGIGVDTGSVSRRGAFGGSTTESTGFQSSKVRTADGEYLIQQPVSGAHILFGDPAVDGGHIRWFMDDLNKGDKVVFAALCNKRNQCAFWLPKPDKPGKDYTTVGWFVPFRAKTNANTLCGTGKLTKEAEAQVCGPAAEAEAEANAEKAADPVKAMNDMAKKMIHDNLEIACRMPLNPGVQPIPCPKDEKEK